MTKEITKAFILQQIQDKFKLREFDRAKFLFDETVVPVYDIADHLVEWRTGTEVVTVVSTNGQKFFTVPPTERWTLNGYNVIFMTGVYTVAGVYIMRKNSTSSFVYLDLTAAQSISYAINLPKPVTLDAGDSLWANVDGYTSSGELRLYMDFKKEEIR